MKKVKYFNKIISLILIEVFLVTQSAWGVLGDFTDIMPVSAGSFNNDAVYLQAQSDETATSSTSASDIGAVLAKMGISGIEDSVPCEIRQKAVLDVSFTEDNERILTFGEIPDNSSSQHNIEGFIICVPESPESEIMQVKTLVQKGSLENFVDSSDIAEVETVNELTSDEPISKITSLETGESYLFYSVYQEDTGSYVDYPLITPASLKDNIDIEIEKINSYLETTESLSDFSTEESLAEVEVDEDGEVIALPEISTELQNEIDSLNSDKESLIVIKNQLDNGVITLSEASKKFLTLRFDRVKKQSEDILNNSTAYLNNSLLGFPLADIWFSEEADLNKDKKLEIIKAWIKQYPPKYYLNSPDKIFISEEEYRSFKDDVEKLANKELSTFQEIRTVFDNMLSFFSLVLDQFYNLSVENPDFYEENLELEDVKENILHAHASILEMKRILQQYSCYEDEETVRLFYENIDETVRLTEERADDGVGVLVGLLTKPLKALSDYPVLINELENSVSEYNNENTYDYLPYDVFQSLVSCLGEEEEEVRNEKIEEFFRNLESMTSAKIDSIYSDLKLYADTKLNEEFGEGYVDSIDSIKTKISEYESLRDNLESEISDFSIRPGELLTAIEELSNISWGLSNFKNIVTQGLFLHTTIEGYLNINSPALGRIVMETIYGTGSFLCGCSPAALFIDCDDIDYDSVLDIHSRLSNLQDEVDALVTSTVVNLEEVTSDELKDVMVQLGLAPSGISDSAGSAETTLVEELGEEFKSLMKSYKIESVASIATKEVLQFAAFSLVMGGLGNAIRSAATFTRIAKAFKSLKSLGRIGKLVYKVGRGIGKAIKVFNYIDEYVQELSLALMGRPGLWIARSLFPGSKLAPLLLRTGINSLVIGVSSGLANYYQGTGVGTAASIVRNPLTALNMIGGGNLAWMNSVIEPFGIPLPDIAEFLHLIVYGTGGARVYHSQAKAAEYKLNLVNTALTAAGQEQLPEEIVFMHSGGGPDTSPWIKSAYAKIRNLYNGIRGIDSSGTAEQTTDTTEGQESTTQPVDTTPAATESTTSTTSQKINNILEKIGLKRESSSVTRLSEYSNAEIEAAVEKLTFKNENGNAVDIDFNRISNMLKAVRNGLSGGNAGEFQVWVDAYQAVEEHYDSKEGQPGKTPHINQLIGAFIQAGEASNKRIFLNIGTGQGKTIITALTNYVLHDKYDLVVNITSHAQLAERDFDKLKTFYESMGVKFAQINSEGKLVDSDGNELSSLTEVDVVYAEYSKPTFYVLGQMANNEFGDWDAIKESSALLIDEVDAIAVEQAQSPLIISQTGAEGYYDTKKAKDFFKEVGEYAKGEASLSTRTLEYLNDYIKGNITLSDLRRSGVIPLTVIANETPESIRELAVAIVNSPDIYSRYSGKYIVEEVDGKTQIIIVSDFSFEPQLGKKWTAWHHQIVEAAHMEDGGDLKISRKGTTSQILTMPFFINHFAYVSGASGTANVFSDILRDIYGATTVNLPDSFVQERFDRIVGYKTESAKIEAMFDAAVESAKKGYSVLLTTIPKNVGMDSIGDFVSELNSRLEQAGISAEIQVQKYDAHDWLDSARRETIENSAAQAFTVTVTTPILGRGMDITGKTPLVVIADRLFSEWSAKQIVGRAYRGDSIGASFTFFSVEKEQFEVRRRITKVEEEIGELHNRKSGLDSAIQELQDSEDPSPESIIGLLQLEKQNIDDKINEKESQLEQYQEIVEGLESLVEKDEGTFIDFNNASVVAVREMHIEAIHESIRQLIETHQSVYEFETTYKEDHFVRPLLDRIESDPYGLYQDFKRDISDLNIRDIVNNSSLITEKDKQEMLRLVDAIDSGVDEEYFNSRYLDNDEGRNALIAEFLKKHMSFYKILVLDHSENYENVDEAYNLYRIKVLTDIIVDTAIGS